MSRSAIMDDLTRGLQAIIEPKMAELREEHTREMRREMKEARTQHMQELCRALKDMQDTHAEQQEEI
ncbi:hypothetical protein QFC22_002055 [Naganishia vaughanmartiniae]|uniref:Uncharacterized protein n=1 Tax=Naganishia vaughanmartiniae TaxID=1424756 RepID=A0ACC2XGW2_9TREE|nr:hypothetical protein QFC22_002055 [Naganishia vaughanmartiniae]